MGLVIRGLGVRYGRRTAVDGLDLEVPDGTITGFLGHNGAGKTSAMRGILGLSPRTRGRVWVDGIDARRRPAELTARVGALIETTAFWPGWSARRNLIELGRLQGLPRADLGREADRCLERVRLTAAASRSPQEFSQGMRQRLGLAQALLGGRRILLLDEPTNGLDPEGIAELHQLLVELRDRDRAAILLSSHQLAEVEQLCDRVAVLRQGQLVAAGDTDSLLASVGRPHRTVAEDGERARATLQGLGLEVQARGRELWFELGERSAEQTLAALVQGGARPQSFAPAPRGLDAIYRRAAAGALGLAVPAGEPQQPAASEPRARRGALLRLLAFESRRHLAAAWLLALPALGALLSILLSARRAADAALEVSGGESFSTTDVTAFQAAAGGLALGLPLAAWVAALFASQLLAGELGRGTLRNVALRPLTRLQLGFGKSLFALGLGLVAFGAAAVAALGGAALWFDFADLDELLVTGERFPILAAAEVWPELWATLAGGAAIVPCFAALGLLAGALTTRGVTAQVATLLVLLGSMLGRWISHDTALEWLNPATYLPFLSADTSRVAALGKLATGATNAPFEFAATEYWVPLGVTCASLLISLGTLLRRSIP
jgi:ABC-type multidrug transport system ATPase subunit